MHEPHHFNLLSRVNGFGFPFVGAPLDLTRQRESQNHQIVMTGKKIKSKLEMRKKNCNNQQDAEFITADQQQRRGKNENIFKECFPSHHCCCCCCRFHYNFAESFFSSLVEGNKLYWASLSVAIRDDVTYWCVFVCAVLRRIAVAASRICTGYKLSTI